MFIVNDVHLSEVQVTSNLASIQHWRTINNFLVIGNNAIFVSSHVVIMFLVVYHCTLLEESNQIHKNQRD